LGAKYISKSIIKEKIYPPIAISTPLIIEAAKSKPITAKIDKNRAFFIQSLPFYIVRYKKHTFPIPLYNISYFLSRLPPSFFSRSAFSYFLFIFY
jgi:hypothetical protein